MADKFMFFAQFAENIRDMFPNDELRQAQAYKAFCEYGVYETLPDDPVLRGMCLMAKVSLQKHKNWGGARTGAGAPQGNKNATKNNQNNQVNQDENLIKKNNQVNQPFLETETERETEIKKQKIPPLNAPPAGGRQYENDFDEFWKAYTPIQVRDGRTVPKGSKSLAHDRYVAIRKKGVPHAEIMSGMRTYLQNCEASDTLSCQVSVFLSKQRWKDEPITQQRKEEFYL